MTAKRAPEEDSSTMSDPTKKVKVTDAVHAGNKEAADHHDKHGDDWVREPPFQLETAPEDFKPKYRQRCWCGKTRFSYSEDPKQIKFCHCKDCQRLHGSPYQHAAIFSKDSVKLDSDAEWVGFLSAHGEVHPLGPTYSPLPHKVSCRACGCPLFDEGKNMVIAYPPSFEWRRTKDDTERTVDGGPDEPIGIPKVFHTACHIFYEQRVFDINDGVDKWAKHREDSDLLDDKGNVIKKADEVRREKQEREKQENQNGDK